MPREVTSFIIDALYDAAKRVTRESTVCQGPGTLPPETETDCTLRSQSIHYAIMTEEERAAARRRYSVRENLERIHPGKMCELSAGYCGFGQHTTSPDAWVWMAAAARVMDIRDAEIPHLSKYKSIESDASLAKKICHTPPGRPYYHGCEDAVQRALNSVDTTHHAAAEVGYYQGVADALLGIGFQPLSVYRGIGKDQARAAKAVLSRKGSVKVGLRPISSWSLDIGQARRSAYDGGAVITTIVVDADSIAHTSLGNSSCVAAEREVGLRLRELTVTEKDIEFL